MASNLDIDQTLLNEALRLSKLKTKRETVNLALSEYIKRRKQKEILSSFGKIEFEAKYNYKHLRGR